MYLFFLGWSIRDPAFQTALNENIPRDQRGKFFAFSFFAFYGGSFVGNLIISWFFDVLSTPILFFLFHLILDTQFLLILIFLKDTSSQRNKNYSLKREFWKIWNELIKQPKYRKAFLFFFLDGFFWGIGTVILPGSLKAKLGIEESRLGVIMMAYSISIIITL